MEKTAHRSYACLITLAAAVALGLMAILLGWPIVPAGLIAYLVLALLPGALIYRALADEPGVLETILAATALSPVLTAAGGVIAMLLGFDARVTALALLVITGGLGLAVCFFSVRGRPRPRWELGGRHTAVLLGFIAVLCVAISIPAFANEWWRLRSDAWFHGAVIYEILEYGIPPQDPYFVGLPLQYMWFFHVYIAIVAEASGIGLFMVMALFNIQAIIAYALAAFLFSSLFKKSFQHNFAATITSILGINALFWLFLPIKMLRAFTGEVRGSEDLARLLDLTPFGIQTARHFARVGFNQLFFLDKFMVATAFSLGVALMAFLWYGATRYLTTGKSYALFFVLVAGFGVVVFHPAIGTLMYAGLGGGLCLLFLLKGRVDDLDRGRIVRLIGVLVVAGILFAPYLYSVVHAKTGGEGLPLGLSAPKFIGLFISCALAIFLAAFQAVRLFRSRQSNVWLLLCATAAVFGACALVNLPAANSYDKLPFLVFFPLAVVGGWTIAEFAQQSTSVRTQWLRFAVISFVAFAPLNLFMLAAYYNTAPILQLDDNEKQIASWVRDHTPRDAVFFDNDDRVFLLVPGPRRYYAGSANYAMQWGYDDDIIDARFHVKENLYSSDDPDALTLKTLGSIDEDVYVILRSDEPTGTIDKFESLPELFEKMHSHDAITLFKVNRPACRAIADALGGPQ